LYHLWLYYTRPCGQLQEDNHQQARDFTEMNVKLHAARLSWIDLNNQLFYNKNNLEIKLRDCVKSTKDVICHV